jgi:hypothetical protein
MKPVSREENKEIINKDREKTGRKKTRNHKE